MKKFLLLIILFFAISLSAQVTITMEQDGGVYKVPCVVNGAKMKFIFDTGAATVCLSESMAEYLLDNDYITKDDILGTGTSQVADGRIVDHVKINLRDIEIAGLHLKDVEAVVVEGQRAPLLLGQTAIQKLGKVSIDGNKLIIERGGLDCFPDIDGYNGTLSDLIKLAQNERYTTSYKYTTQLANCYYFGKCIPVDYAQALYWFKIGANKNDPVAQCALGNMYFEGMGCDIDYSESFYWLKKSAENNYELAMCNLAYSYLNGKGVSKNKYDAFYWYCQAAKTMDIEAASKTIALLMEDFRKSADEDLNAALQLGLYYYEWSKEPNLNEAKIWLQKSADLGGSICLFYLGEINKKLKNNPKAIFWYMKAIAANDTYAMNTMAYAYALGEMGLNKDMNAAFELINKAICIAEENGGYAPDYYDSKGEFYAMQNDYKNAKLMWEKVNSLDPIFYERYNSELNKYVLKYKSK